MKIKERAKPIKSLSSADFVNLFLADAGSYHRYRHCDIQIYDYKMIADRMRVPTIIFRPTYNYILLLQSGNILMQFGTEVNRVHGPATLFVSAGQTISVQDISDDICGTLVILENDSLNQIFSKQELLRILEIALVTTQSKEDQSLINDIGRLLLKEFQSKRRVLQVLVAMTQALLHIMLEQSTVNEVTSRNHTVALKFKELVYKNFAAQKNISFYTLKLDVSENYLNRCTRLIYNKSAKRFILEVAILESQLLLQDMQKGVAEVAYELNFDDSSYFTRIFRKITGITPSAYKQQIILNRSTLR